MLGACYSISCFYLICSVYVPEHVTLCQGSSILPIEEPRGLRPHCDRYIDEEKPLLLLTPYTGKLHHAILFYDALKARILQSVQIVMLSEQHLHHDCDGFCWELVISLALSSNRETLSPLAGE